MDAFLIYSINGNLLIEQNFSYKLNKEFPHDLNTLINEKKKGNYFFILKNEYENGNEIKTNIGYDIKKKIDNDFVYLIEKDKLIFVSIVQNENNPMLIIEMMYEIIDILKGYFNITKLNETVLINNYSIVNFLINEILIKGKPNLFVQEILKRLIKNDTNYINETLKTSLLSSNIYNMITKKKSNLMNNSIDKNNINFSYSNGNSINSVEFVNNYWRVSYNNINNNEIYIDMIDYVNCIVKKFNKIIHYSIEGNINVNSNINGCPLILLHITNIDLHNCQFHYTVDYKKTINHKKENKTNEDIIYFTPLNHEYTVLKYFMYYSKKIKDKDNSFCNELTDVLNIENKELEEDDNNINQENNNKKENDLENLNYKEINLDTDNESINSDVFETDYDNTKLPVHVDSNILYIEADNMYKIKINLKFNNINKENNSNVLLNNYENILVKMPIHNLINSVTFHSSIGMINFNEKLNCLFWFIKTLKDDENNIVNPIYININLYLKSNQNIFHSLYSSFNFVIYISLKVNGLSIFFFFLLIL